MKANVPLLVTQPDRGLKVVAHEAIDCVAGIRLVVVQVRLDRLSPKALQFQAPLKKAAVQARGVRQPYTVRSVAGSEKQNDEDKSVGHLPHNGSAHNLQGPPPQVLRADQGCRQSTTIDLLGVSRDEVAEIAPTPSNALSGSGACYAASTAGYLRKLGTSSPINVQGAVRPSFEYHPIPSQVA
jgi:hypothetical protein